MNKELEKVINKKANPEQAKNLQRFFKTGKGEYGEGDIFLGIVVPEQRKIAKEFKYISLEEIHELLNDEIHEKRLIGLLILIEQLKKADEDFKKQTFELYLNNTKNINNWDLVDLSAPRIVGNYLLNKDRKIIYELAHSSHLWEKRIAIISTAWFIKENQFDDTIRISEILLRDSHDLIHKAVGWMLREVGKKDLDVLRGFLKKHYKNMPRTMLRYAIEKMNEKERKKWLEGKV